MPLSPIPLQIGGEWLNGATFGDGHDPARPDQVVYQYALADAAQVKIDASRATAR